MSQPSNKDPFAAPGFTPPPVHKPMASPPKVPAPAAKPLPAPPPPPLRKKPADPDDQTLLLPPKPAAKRPAGFTFTDDTPAPAKGLGPRMSPAAAPATGPSPAPEFPSGGERSFHSIPSQDLTGEKLLMPAVRTQFENACAPALGGIPLLAKLGQGGMGAVYLGVDPKSNQEVAVKVLPFHMAERDPALIERFFREARMSMSVSSPNLVRVTDAKEENGLCYLVMEFVPGASGGGYMKKSKGARLSEADALDICIAATKGLSAAHKAGIIHRDIKPDNILLPQGGAPGQFNLSGSKLADLGLARTEEHGNSLTQSQTAMGTPGYLAPEQAMDARKCGKPADVFSMGATIYAMLTGRPPFHAKSPMEVIMATMNKPHDPLPSLRPDVSAATVALVDRCLQKEAQHRFRDADALLAAMQLCREVLAHPERQAQAIEKIRGNPPPAAPVKAEQPFFNELTMQAPTPLRRPDIEAEAGIAKLRSDESRARSLPTIAAVIMAGFWSQA
ncbi:MAG: serine/threonine protein kinase [Planctomycetota bacterium]|nr:serine/threonine protein kinase [Planctomycetota bacterium]